ncbi:MAG: exodeoxyribonuclease V subunit alpha [Sphingobacteriales bacterium]|nr:MAG: exodeoxyribonuclease V subunit alpha [Sphingobacteriales bacterium]TAF82444.1 MAG: exodeoxyribonuclease V subunit alpha [Sphingobacteriales bacterium]
MKTLSDTHHQFASFFESKTLQPYAYMLSKKLSEGHICIDITDIENEREKLPTYFKNSFFDIATLLKEPLVALQNGTKQPFIWHNNRLYLQRYFSYESDILAQIVAWGSNNIEQITKRMEALRLESTFIKNIFETGINTKQPNWQLVATLMGALQNFTIITGGPGTGKTTTVAKILAILFKINPFLKVALAAPTGKAAARMGESLKATSLSPDSNIPTNIASKFALLQPLTIQRLLGFIPNSLHFKHHETNPLNYDVIIIDEASMIDVALFAKLLNAIGPNSRIILLGDKNQLASVEAGSLFGDLCQAQQNLNILNAHTQTFINHFITHEEEKISTNHNTKQTPSHPLFQHIIELKFSHRFKNNEGIGQFSKAIIQNNVSFLKNFLLANADDQVVIDTQYSPTFLENFIAGYKDYIHESDIKIALHKFNKLRILCAIRESNQGVYALNKIVERYLSHKNLIDTHSQFYIHRPVMITRNNYVLNIFNGDIGLVRPDENGELKVWFEGEDGKLTGILTGLINHAETVFAMSIHKSQGSEYDKVMVVLPQQQNMAILTRELLYTGLTRAKNKIFLQASHEVILHAAQSQVMRSSGIAFRFLENNA